MAAWKSSSLAFSDIDHNSMRSKNGLMKNLPTRISKQDIVTHKMFGRNRGKHGKDIKIGRKFKKGMSTRLAGDVKSSAISPSIEEFDNMMSSLTGKSKKNKMGSSKRGLFSRKSFD